MELWIMIGVMVLVVLGIKTVIQAVIDGATNMPTWNGIIISTLLGALPFYLIMCWFGWWGEERDKFDKH